jgi:argininosuccinate synthase
VDIEFGKGDPVAINGKRMSPAWILTELNKVSQRGCTGFSFAVFPDLTSHAVAECESKLEA